jgi:hypothetical protein
VFYSLLSFSLVSLPIPRFSTFFPGFDLFNFFVWCLILIHFFRKTDSNDWELRPTCSSSIWRFAISSLVVSTHWPSIPRSGDAGLSVKQVHNYTFNAYGLGRRWCISLRWIVSWHTL